MTQDPLNKIPIREYDPPTLRRPPRKPTPPYLPMALGIFILILAVVVGFLVAGNNDSEFANVTVMPRQSASCILTAERDVNVRIGPSYEYGRAWILAKGEQRVAVARMGHSWFQVKNGWIPREDVSLGAALVCANLPQADPIPLFDDDLVPPEAVLALGWSEILGENFATTVNDWANIENNHPAGIKEGELILENGARVAPSQAETADAYYVFDGFWSSGGVNSTLVFSIRGSGQGEYQLSIQRSGQVRLVFLSGEAVVIASTTVPEIGMNQRFEAGIMCLGSRFEVFWNGESVLSADHNGLSAGRYAFEAQGGVVHLRRFEVNTGLE